MEGDGSVEDARAGDAEVGVGFSCFVALVGDDEDYMVGGGSG